MPCLSGDGEVFNLGDHGDKQEPEQCVNQYNRVLRRMLEGRTCKKGSTQGLVLKAFINRPQKFGSSDQFCCAEGHLKSCKSCSVGSL